MLFGNKRNSLKGRYPLIFPGKKNLERRHCTWSRILMSLAGGIWLAIGGKLSHQFLVSWSVEFWHSGLIFFNEFLESRPFKHVLLDLNNFSEGSVSFTFSGKESVASTSDLVQNIDVSGSGEQVGYSG